MGKIPKKRRKKFLMDESLEREEEVLQECKKKRKSNGTAGPSVVLKRKSMEKLGRDDHALGKSSNLEDFPEDHMKEAVNTEERYPSGDYLDVKNRILTDASGSADAVLVMLDDEELVLQGTADIKVLHGSVQILGYNLFKSEEFTRIFSPSSNSLLTVTNINSSSSKLKGSPDLGFVSDGSVRKNILRISKKCEHPSVICIKPFKSVVLNFVTSYTPFQNLLHCTSKSDSANHRIHNIDITIVTDPSVSRFTVTEDYQFVKENLLKYIQQGDRAPVVAVCGGKNVGKSTLCRYLTNILLNHVDEVAFLECDVGQTEFTLSGCVSLTVVKKPLLGPPFTHLTQPTVCTFYGHLSPAEDPGFYMECVQDLYQHYTTELSHLPLVVNTMGWNKGLGIHLLIDSLRTVNPALVVQIDVSRQAHNLPSMRPEFVNRTPGWVTSMSSTEESAVEYQFAIISSATRQHEHHEKLKAADHRHLSLLAYFGPISTQRSLTAIPPYSVPWYSMAVYISHTDVPQTQLLYALNASIVALYKVPQEMICKSDIDDYPKLLTKQPKRGYLGFGLIRGIDPVKKVFYILTPVHKHVLRDVNALVRGALDLPPQVLLKQKGGGSLPPYIDFTRDTMAGGGVKVRRPMLRHYRALPYRDDQ